MPSFRTETSRGVEFVPGFPDGYEIGGRDEGFVPAPFQGQAMFDSVPKVLQINNPEKSGELRRPTTPSPLRGSVHHLPQKQKTDRLFFTETIIFTIR